MVLMGWRQAWLALRFFLLWGICFGGLLGFITGSLIFPIFGTLYSTIWGLAMGFGLGLAASIITAILTLIIPVVTKNAKVYRRRLSIGVGIFVALASGLIVHVTSEGILWYPSYYVGDLVEFTPYHLPSILSAICWGGLSAAFVAHRFVEHCAYEIQDHFPRNYRPAAFDFPGDTAAYWLGKFVRRWGIYPVMAVAGGIIVQNMASGYSGLTEVSGTAVFMNGMVIGVLYAAVTAILIGVSNGLLLTFINRIYFHEFYPDMTQERYQQIVGIMAGLFTLTITVMMAFGLFAPQAGALLYTTSTLQALIVGLLAALFAAITASLIAREYSERYFTIQENNKRWAMQLTNGRSALVFSQDDTRAKIVHRYVDPDSKITRHLFEDEDMADQSHISSQSEARTSSLDGLTN